MRRIVAVLKPADRLTFGVLLGIVLTGCLGFYFTGGGGPRTNRNEGFGSFRFQQPSRLGPGFILPGEFPPAQTFFQSLGGPEPEVLRQTQLLDSKVAMIFPHFGDGAGGGVSLQTTILLINTSNYPTRGVVRFIGSNGAPASVKVGNQTASFFEFEFEHGPAQDPAVRLVTSGTGALKTGWILVESEQPISGTCSFAVKDEADKLISDVGVGVSVPGPEFTVFADSLGDSNTGVALANPSVSDSITLDLQLLNPEGSEVASAQLELGPQQHDAKFVTELFKQIAGISEFEGSMRVKSRPAAEGSGEPLPFAAMSLRTTGLQYTSVPVIPPLPAEATWDEIAFPHMGDGDFGTLSISTIVVLFNGTDHLLSGHVDFIGSAGELIDVTANGETKNSFDLKIPARGIRRLVTSGKGAAKTGWVRAAMDGPILGNTLFQIRNSGNGSLATEVGVPSGRLDSKVLVVADTTEDFNTGIALVNPTSEEQEVICRLMDLKTGTLESKQLAPLNPFEHRALFVTELFDGVAGVDEMEGLLSCSGDEIFGLPLRAAGEKLTSTPLLQGTYGFADDSLFEPAQRLTSSTPAVHWTLHHSSNTDFSLGKVVISAPQVGLRTDSIREGDSIGWGFIGADSLSYIQDLKVTAKGSLEFDLVTANANGAVLAGTGHMEGTPNAGLVMELDLSAAPPFSTSRAGDVHFYFGPGLFWFPNMESVTLETALVSVSTRPEGYVPVTRRLSKQIDLTPAAPGKPYITAAHPLIWSGGTQALIEGGNFTDETRLLCPLSNGETAEVYALEVSSGQMEVIVPEGIGDGPIRAVNTTGEGNGLQIKSLFGPDASMLLGTPQSERQVISLHTRQPAGQLAIARFELYCRGFGLSQEGLSVGDQVGQGTFRLNTSSYPVEGRVTDLTGGTIGIELVDDDGDPAYRGTAAIDAEDDSLLVILLEPLGEEQPWGPDGSAPFILQNPAETELEFSGFLTSTGERKSCDLVLVSSPRTPGFEKLVFSLGQVHYLGGN